MLRNCPAAEDFTDPEGPSMDAAGSLGGRFCGNGKSSSPPAPHASSATTESTRRGGSHPCFEWVL